MIGKRMREARINKGLTLIGLSELLEVSTGISLSQATLSKYETGDIKTIPQDNVEAIAKVLDIDVSFLMGWGETKSVSDTLIEELTNKTTLKELKWKSLVELELIMTGTKIPEAIPEKLDSIMERIFENNDLNFSLLLSKESFYSERNGLFILIKRRALSIDKGNAPFYLELYISDYDKIIGIKYNELLENLFNAIIDEGTEQSINLIKSMLENLRKDD